MKKLIYFLSFTFFIACKPSAERDDAKYLGTWKSNPVLDDGNIFLHELHQKTA